MIVTVDPCGDTRRSYGKRSKAEMHQVHPEVIAWSYVALHTTPYDVSFHDGVRTAKQQEANLASGASRSVNSYHVPLFPGGYSDAVDLVPYVDGGNTWEWIYVLPNALAIIRAAMSLGIDGTWGGVWDRRFSQLNLENVETLRAEMHAYAARRRAAGGTAFHDGCHFQRKSRTRSLKDLAV